MKTLRIFVSTDADTTNWEIGERMLDLFNSRAPKLKPEELFQWGSLVADFSTIDECRPYWSQSAKMEANGVLYDFPVGLRWKRNHAIKYDAEIQHTTQNLRGKLSPGSFRFYADYKANIDWLTLFGEICKSMRASFALMHVFSKNEIREIEKGGENENRHLYTLSEFHEGRRGVFGIAWANFYGESYARRIKTNDIRQAGVDFIEMDCGILVRLTENISDVLNDPIKIKEKKTQLKNSFPAEFFIGVES